MFVVTSGKIFRKPIKKPNPSKDFSLVSIWPSFSSHLTTSSSFLVAPVFVGGYVSKVIHYGKVKHCCVSVGEAKKGKAGIISTLVCFTPPDCKENQPCLIQIKGMRI